MLGSPLAMVTPYRIGTDTQTCCLKVSVQLVPPQSVVQVTQGLPWQVTVGVPMTAVGFSVSGAAISTHWVATLLQPAGGQDSSTGQDWSGVCS